MKKEISILDIMETIGKGKWIISIFVLISLLISFVANYFIMKPNYEAIALVKVNFDDKGQKGFVSLTEEIKSDITINKVITSLGLDKKSLSQLKNNINVQEYKNSNLIVIKVRGKDTKLITTISNMVASELAATVEVTDRLEKNATYYAKSVELQHSIVAATSERDKLASELEQLPEKLVTMKAVADEPYMQSIVKENSNSTNKNIGALQIASEEYNPVYLAFKEKLSAISVALSKLEAENKDLKDKIEENKKAADHLIANKNALNNETVVNYLMSYKAVIITPALEPMMPVGPSKAISVVLTGIIVGLFTMIFIIIKGFIKGAQASYPKRKIIEGEL